MGVGITIIAIAAAWILWYIRPRSDKPARAINANHHGLYLLVNDLVTTQKRGYMTVFPDEESYQEAQRLLTGYRDQITTTGPSLAIPGPDPSAGLMPQWHSESRSRPRVEVDGAEDLA